MSGTWGQGYAVMRAADKRKYPRVSIKRALDLNWVYYEYYE